MAQKINTQGQVALWVIIALGIVLIIGFVFVIQKKPVLSEQAVSQSPALFIEACAKKAMNDAADIMIPQAGLLHPDDYVVFANISIPYLCKNIGYFGTCIHQHPLLFDEMKADLLSFVQPKVSACFAQLTDELAKKNKQVRLGAVGTSIQLKPGQILTHIDSNLSITDSDGTQTFTLFESSIANPLYDLGAVALDIVRQEAQTCYFEYVGYMAAYPRFEIHKQALLDSTKLYTIRDIKSQEEMHLAVRGCAIPPGI